MGLASFVVLLGPLLKRLAMGPRLRPMLALLPRTCTFGTALGSRRITRGAYEVRGLFACRELRVEGSPGLANNRHESEKFSKA